MKLTKNQREAFRRATQAGGLQYVKGGYWIETGIEPSVFLAYSWRDENRPWHTSTQTVRSLVNRGLLEWADTIPGYPVKAVPTNSLQGWADIIREQS